MKFKESLRQMFIGLWAGVSVTLGVVLAQYAIQTGHSNNMDWKRATNGLLVLIVVVLLPVVVVKANKAYLALKQKKAQQ